MRFPLTMFLAILLVVPACKRNEPQRTQAASEERTNATEQLKNERDAYVKTTDARLAEFDQKFDGLDKRAGTMTGTEKTNFTKAIGDLRDQRKAVSAKLDDLKKVNIESWTTEKGEVDSALASLNRSYTEVSDKYKIPATSTTPKTKTY